MDHLFTEHEVFQKLYLLCDCNNFFVSCERIFRPDLEKRPVIVLSNNDGCVIARSKEVKALGIPMGIAVFKIQDLIKRHRIVTFSSNFNLYLDISSRIMRILESLCPEVEIYSVDEAFLSFRNLTENEALDLAFKIKNTITTYIGVPISVGIATSKTLAKLASHEAKSHSEYEGVFSLISTLACDRILPQTQVGEIWGIGKRLQERLHEIKIYNALQLKQSDLKRMRKLFNINLAHTICELRGEDVILELESHNQMQIMWSRSFKEKITAKEDLRQALGAFTAEAAFKLRSLKQFCRKLSIFIRTSYFGTQAKYQAFESLSFDIPTHDTRVLTQAAFKILDLIFKEDFSYAKAGVILSDFSNSRLSQTSLFADPNSNLTEDLKRSDLIMQTLDKVNLKKRNTLFLGSQSLYQQDKRYAQKKLLSPNYTTDFNDLPILK